MVAPDGENPRPERLTTEQEDIQQILQRRTNDGPGNMKDLGRGDYEGDDDDD